MSENKTYPLLKVAMELGIGSHYIVSFLASFGFTIPDRPNSRLTYEMHQLVKVLMHPKSRSMNDDHHRSLLKRRKFDINPVVTLLEPDAMQVLRTKGQWFRALSSGEVVPRNAEEMDFVRCSRGEKAPTTKEEFIWNVYRTAQLSQQNAIAPPQLADISNPWDRCKAQFPIGSVHELTVSRIIPNAWVVLALSADYEALLHLSDLEWNLASGQSYLFQLGHGDRLKVVILSLEDEHKLILVTRKILYPQPREKEGWNQFQRGKFLQKCIVTERTPTRLIVQLPAHFFGFVSLKQLPKEDRLATVMVGEPVKLMILGKDETTGMIRLGSPEMLRVEKIQPHAMQDEELAQLEKVVDKSPQIFVPSDPKLKSLSAFKESIWWRYLEPVEQEHLTSAFRNNGNLFSNVHKGVDELVISFNVAENDVWDQFKFQIAPILIDSVAEDISLETVALDRLSAESFWYNTFQKDEQAVPQFRLFNERFSIVGTFHQDNGRFLIQTIKANHKDKALAEKQKHFRLDCIGLDFPLRFKSPYQSGGPMETQLSYFTVLKEKLEAFAILKKIKQKTLGVMERKGKDFQIFQEYLLSQVEYEELQEETRAIAFNEVILAPERSLNNMETVLYAKCAVEIPYAIGERLEVFRPITTRGNSEVKDEPVGSGIILDIKDSGVLLSIGKQDSSLFLSGFIAQRKVNSRQHLVQAEVIVDYFQGRLKISHFDDILHRPSEISPPTAVELHFIDPNIAADPNGKQAQAVRIGVGNENVVLIQGPPGTGKTTVISEIVRQAVLKGKKIMVCSPTHVAVDAVLRKLKDVNNIHFARIGKPKDHSLIEHLLENKLSKFRISYAVLLRIQKELVQRLLLRVDTVENLYEAARRDLVQHLEEVAEGLRKNASFLQHLERFCSKAALVDTISLQQILQHQTDWLDQVGENEELLHPLFYNSLDVVFGTCLGLAMNQKLIASGVKFDIVILDEAGKANISESLVSLSMGEKLILVGDHQQLPPYLDQERLEYFLANHEAGSRLIPDEVRSALNASFFEFIVELSKHELHPFPKENIVMLNVQHRMHPDISEFVSETFYDGKIKNGPQTHGKLLPLRFPYENAVTFIDTSSIQGGYESFEGGSYLNEAEAKEILYTILPQLLDEGVSKANIAIVTAYSGQRDCIWSLLESSSIEHPEEIEVATLDSFQGREKEVIIFSFTRSAPNKKVGFLDDARRLNVAFSRATTKLIFIGNAQTLTSSGAHFESYYIQLFKNLIKHTKDLGAFIHLNELLRKASRK